MRIGIFGGSFNPVHEGHLKLAREAMSELNLDRVVFVPSCRSPLKAGQDLLPEALRIALLKKAIRGIPGFGLWLCEIRRKGLSYTVDTLKVFKKRFGSRATLYFLAGADVSRDLRRWKSFPEILKLCRFVVMTRPGYRPSRLPKGVLSMPMEALDVSSTGVRSRLRRGRAIEGLVPRGTAPLLRRYYNA